MAEKFMSLIIGFLLLGLFVFSLIEFGYGTARDNGGNQTLLNDQRINKSFPQLQQELSNTKTISENQKTALENDKAVIGGNSLLLFAISTVWKSFSSMIIGIYNITFGLVFDVIFGSSTSSPFVIVFGIFSSILIITISFLAWRLIRTGE